MDHLAMSYSFCLVAAVMTAAVYGYRGATVNASRPDITAPRHHFFALLPHLWRSPMLIMLIILGACDLIAINLFNLLLPLITKYYFNGQSTALSLMDASFTFGAIIMGWYAGRHAIKGRKLHPYLLMMPFALVATIMQIHFFSAALCFLFMLLLGFFCRVLFCLFLCCHSGPHSLFIKGALRSFATHDFHVTCYSFGTFFHFFIPAFWYARGDWRQYCYSINDCGLWHFLDALSSAAPFITRR